ncbi:uncharacterized protein LOC143861776 isoform X2 [Tasmannia lanceolata]|uniref:uncharacterized protein LOC143861776 isoform X2 n=1 Tax=Tasmannia lanceolata TaxID=3420 RepID=UPI004062EE3E
MDCIKEEALRLRGMAEQMIRNEDYIGARDKLNDAKQLFPALENVSQMLTVCNILCAANLDFPNHGMDWYFILQLNPNDDEVTIRSGYEKLCLDLEPIKDEFPGAKSALEYIDKAMSVLSDRGKRSVFDAKRKASWKSSGHAHLINVKPSKKQQIAGVQLTTQKSEVEMNREANEEAMNGFPISVSHHTAAPSSLPSENQPQDSLQPSLPTPTKSTTDQVSDRTRESSPEKEKETKAELTLQAESGDHSPDDSPSPSPSLENPATPLEIPPFDTVIDYIEDLRLLILDESFSSPENQSSSLVQLESTEIQNAKKIVGMASSMELQLFVSEEFQLELKNAIDILLADKNKTPGRTSKLLNFQKYIEHLVPDYKSYLKDLDAAERVCSEVNFLRQTLSQTVDRMERLADVNRKCKQEKDSILEEKHNLKARIKELFQQQMKIDTSLADNLRLMKELVAKTEEDKMCFRTKITEKWDLKIKEKDANKCLEHLREVWEDKRKLIRDITCKSMEGRKEKN